MAPETPASEMLLRPKPVSLPCNDNLISLRRIILTFQWLSSPLGCNRHTKWSDRKMVHCKDHPRCSSPVQAMPEQSRSRQPLQIDEHEHHVHQRSNSSIPSFRSVPSGRQSIQKKLAHHEGLGHANWFRFKSTINPGSVANMVSDRNPNKPFPERILWDFVN